MSKFWDKMDEYRERFNDQFPLYAMPDAPDEEIMETIDECIKAGKPFKYGKPGENY